MNKRNWLEECYQIRGGNRNVKPKVEHVKAAIEALERLAKSHEKLLGLMNHAYENVAKNRQANGMEMPPMPEALKKYRTVK